jgi:hypothetical protein
MFSIRELRVDTSTQLSSLSRVPGRKIDPYLPGTREAINKFLAFKISSAEQKRAIRYLTHHFFCSRYPFSCFSPEPRYADPSRISTHPTPNDAFPSRSTRSRSQNEKDPRMYAEAPACRVLWGSGSGTFFGILCYRMWLSQHVSVELATRIATRTISEEPFNWERPDEN